MTCYAMQLRYEEAPARVTGMRAGYLASGTGIGVGCELRHIKLFPWTSGAEVFFPLRALCRIAANVTFLRITKQVKNSLP